MFLSISNFCHLSDLFLKQQSDNSACGLTQAEPQLYHHRLNFFSLRWALSSPLMPIREPLELGRDGTKMDSVGVAASYQLRSKGLVCVVGWKLRRLFS
jgi:hypothetical protein